MTELSGAESQNSTGRGAEVLLGAVEAVPAAAKAFAEDAWQHPKQFVEHSGAALGESAVIGLALGYLLPSTRLAAGLATAAFTLPLAVGSISRVARAYEAGNSEGANIDALSRSLAKDIVSGSWDFLLGSAGGYAGAGIGHRIATSDTAFGSFSQTIQRDMLSAQSSAGSRLKTMGAAIKDLALRPSIPEATAHAFEGAEVSDAAVTPTAGIRRFWPLLKEATYTPALAPGQTGPREYVLRMGSLHGHSHYSDGMGSPAEIYAKAKADGMDFYAITDHNHLAARQGVKPTDPRAADQNGVPILASMPQEYAQTMADAAAATEPGKFVALVGVEMGTIGHVGAGGHGGGHGGGIEGTIEGEVPAGADPDSAEGEVFHLAGHDTILGAGHHHGLPEAFASLAVPDNLPAPKTVRRIYEPDGTVIEHEHTLPQSAAAQAYREQMFLKAQKPAAAVDTHTAAEQAPLSPQQQAIADAAARDAGHFSGINHVTVFEYPQLIIADRAGDTGPQAAGAIHYNDGDFNGLLKQIGDSADTTGKLPVWQLNHPRYLADNNPNLPDNLRGRDYGTKSFPSEDAWRQAMDPRVHQVEVIVGEALNPNPISVMRPQDLAPVNMAGYIDKGLHVSPTYGRDDHFALPGGRPAGTGIIADNLTKEDLLDGLRNRQTIATTSTELLKGYMTANETYPMGSILDQNDVNDLTFKMHVAGKIDSQAKYTVSLWSDPKIGDGKLATRMQTRSLTGQDLLQTTGQVVFDQVHHTLGNKSAWYVEVQRTDPATSNNDYMWTAPIWIEPASGPQHSWLTRALVGAGTSYLFGKKS